MSSYELDAALSHLLEGACHPVASLANAAALLWEGLPDLNWAGFYLLDQGTLWLAPFQGKVACTRIEPGKGVCGTALLQNRTLVVPDVHRFPGHIACDAASRSEIVVPLRVKGRPVGVLDLDSPSLDRFDENDRLLLEAVAHTLEARVDFSRLSYDLQL